MKYLITHNEAEVISITEAHGGTLRVGTNAVVTTLENAKNMLDAIGIDRSKIDLFENELKRETQE